MEKQTYIISYQLFLNDYSDIQSKIRVKNCMSEIHAKVKVEDYLKKKHKNFKRLVIVEWYRDNLSDLFSTIFK